MKKTSSPTCLRFSGKFPLPLKGPLGTPYIFYETDSPLRVSDGGLFENHLEIKTLVEKILQRPILIRWNLPYSKTMENFGIIESCSAKT